MTSSKGAGRANNNPGCSWTLFTAPKRRCTACSPGLIKRIPEESQTTANNNKQDCNETKRSVDRLSKGLIRVAVVGAHGVAEVLADGWDLVVWCCPLSSGWVCWSVGRSVEFLIKVCHHREIGSLWTFNEHPEWGHISPQDDRALSAQDAFRGCLIHAGIGTGVGFSDTLRHK